MSEYKIALVFVLAVVGWFAYAIERERRQKIENVVKSFYGEKWEEYLEKKAFLQNTDAADVKKILEKKVKTLAVVTASILAMLAAKAVQWLSELKQSMMERLSINTETIEQ